MKVGAQIPLNVTPICETSTDLSCDGKDALWKTFLGNHSKDRLFHLVHWLCITLSLRRTSQESINLEKNLTWIVPRIRSVRRVGIWKGGRTGRRPWGVGGRWTHQKSSQKKYSMRKDEWWADSMECYCHLRNIQDFSSDGKTPYERTVSECHLTDQ